MINLLPRKKVPVFILGCQRSGTTICQNVFLASRRFAVFPEGNRNAMDENWRLRDFDEIAELIRKTNRPYQIFKPLNDSQSADRILGAFDNAVSIWIFRDFLDTANSAVAKWQNSQRDMVQWIGDAFHEEKSRDAAMRRIASKHNFEIYAERLDGDTLENVIAWTRGEVSPHTGAAIMWYMRNSIVFDQHLDEEPRMLLVRYEDFARAPQEQLRRICGFMGARYSSSLAKGVFDSSVGRSLPPVIADDVRSACEALTNRLGSALAAQLERAN